jgi:DNA polymerase III subunit delta'
MSFDSFPEQAEAKRLLTAALGDGNQLAHAYLFHGPPGVGKRRAAIAFAGALLGDAPRVARGAHPDLYTLEPVGDQILIDDIRALHHDLHMRPFEASKRVYVLLDAQALNEAAADALLKDLEEPPPYAVIVLVADDLGSLPETIQSRCQAIPFRRLSEAAVRADLLERAPGLSDTELSAIARLAAGRLDRAERLVDPDSRRRRDALLEVARSVYADVFEPADAARTLLDSMRERGATAKEREEAFVGTLDLTAREADQRVRRAQRRAERDELLASLEELAWWYRDLIAVATGAEGAAVHSDRLEHLRADATRERIAGAETACEVVRETWRSFEEFNIAPQLALEALFVRLRRELAGVAIPVS